MSTTGQPLTVRELVKQLLELDPDKKVTAFASGDNYPVIYAHVVDPEYVELACGWESYGENWELEGL